MTTTNTLDIQSIRGRLAALIASEKAGDTEGATRLQSVIEAHYASDVAELLAQLDAKDTEIATKDVQIAERDATISMVTETLESIMDYSDDLSARLAAKSCLQSLKEPNT